MYIARMDSWILTEITPASNFGRKSVLTGPHERGKKKEKEDQKKKKGKKKIGIQLNELITIDIAFVFWVQQVK